MTYLRLLALFVLLVPTVWASSSAVLEENLYFDYQKSILTDHSSGKLAGGLTSFEQSLYVDALWTLVEEGSPEALSTLDTVNTIHYDLLQRLRIAILKLKYKRARTIPALLLKELEAKVQKPSVDVNLVYTIAAYEEEIKKAGHARLIKLAKKNPRYSDVSSSAAKKGELSTDIVGDLFYNSPEISQYMNGDYRNGVKIFVFCRENRIYPCLLVMRDGDGQVVRNADGSIWSQKALASSSRGLPSHVTNGNTPAGIHTIDSVMPVADSQLSYGKWRRVILNAVPKSRDESLLKSLLPDSSHSSDWWKQSVVARDIGRGLFRIHGTGKINKDPTAPWYPFMRTSGCVAQRENTYDGVTYQDQRLLLDQIMKAMRLRPEYANETRIKGIFFLLELDDQNAPVTLEDLELRGIE